jgi:uncharacterized alpha-E superfamily protein
MLSRVADALFWMNRYLERAEHIARLVDVGFHLELDLHGVMAGPPEMYWTSLLAILQQPAPVHIEPGTTPQAFITRWLLLDQDNPSSIMSCIYRARSNARSIRGTLSSGIWRALNNLYWQVSDPEFCRHVMESPGDFCQTVTAGGHLFQGVCDATMTHDEGWHFLQLGKYLERADKIVRIVDNKYHLLQELTNPVDLPLLNLQWAGVLRSCMAYEAYQRLYISRVEPECVVEFLLLHPSFPRSVRFCLEHAAEALRAIQGPEKSQADRLLGRVLSELRYGDLDEILAGNFRAFLEGILTRCNQISRAVKEQYALA